jgi:peptidoglycan/LPS O-acetylase OafA/YrhL
MNINIGKPVRAAIAVIAAVIAITIAVQIDGFGSFGPLLWLIPPAIIGGNLALDLGVKGWWPKVVANLSSACAGGFFLYLALNPPAWKGWASAGSLGILALLAVVAAAGWWGDGALFAQKSASSSGRARPMSAVS